MIKAPFLCVSKELGTSQDDVERKNGSLRGFEEVFKKEKSGVNDRSYRQH
jgi:hypothetical protein